MQPQPVMVPPTVGHAAAVREPPRAVRVEGPRVPGIDAGCWSAGVGADVGADETERRNTSDAPVRWCWAGTGSAERRVCGV